MSTRGLDGHWNGLPGDEAAGSVLDALWDAPVAMAVFDSQLRIVRVNPAMEQLNGLSSAEHRGKRVGEALPGLGDIEGFLARVRESGEPVLNVPYVGETSAIPGEKRHWLGSCLPIRGRDGAVIGLCVVVNETSSLRRQEIEARRARAEAEHAALRLEQLQRFGSSLSMALSPERIAAVVLDFCRQTLGVAAGALTSADPADAGRLYGRFGLGEQTIFGLMTSAGALPTPHSDAALSGNAIWIESPEDAERRYPGSAAIIRGASLGAAAIVPLTAEGRAIAVLSVAFAAQRRFDEDERSFFLALAIQCAQALERARLFEAEQRERKRAEQNALLLDTLIAAAPCGLAFVDSELRFVRVNPALAAINGVPMQEHLGHPVSEVVPHAGFLESLKEVCETRAPLELSAERPAGGGQPRYWSIGIHPVSGEDGELLGLSATVTDATELRRLERERERLLAELALAGREQDGSAASLPELLEATPFAFALLDPELRFVRVNSALSAFDRQPLTAHAGRTARELYPEPLALKLEADWRRVLKDGQPLVDVEIAGESCGHRWTFLCTSFPVRAPDGRIVGLGFMARDVSGQRQAQELQDHLMGIVGHDLRNPLAAIVASAGHLLRSPRISDGERRLLERVQSSSGRIERIIRDLLDFAQVRAGRGLPLSPRPTDLSAICREAIDEIRAANPGRSIEQRGEGEPVGEWDPDRLEQMVSNLLTNGLRHGSPRSTVYLRWRGERDSLVLEVENEGPPIGADLLPSVFDPFQQGREQQPGSMGFGLGLFIARQIAEAHGGSIVARVSGENRTVFSVTLPRNTLRVARSC